MNKGTKVKKLKMTKKDTRTFWRAVIITGVLSSLPVLFALAVYFTPEPMRNVPRSHNIEITVNGSEETSAVIPPTFSSSASETANPETYRKEAKTYYSTFQQAIDAYRSNAVGLHRISGEIFQFTNNNSASAYYWCVSSENKISLCSVISIKQNGEYSNLLENGFTQLAAEPAQAYTPFTLYSFTPEEAVADYLANQFFYYVDVQSIPNNGNPTYIGISDSSTIKNLRILGKAPTRIIKSSVKGKTYYIWIYEGLDIRGALLKTKGFTFGGYTDGQIIDILHIHFASPSDPLSKSVPITTAN